MSTDNTVEFLKQIARDPSLAAELVEAQDCAEFLARAATIGERIGYVPDQGRLRAAINRSAPGRPQELDDADLEDVGGGAWLANGLSSILQDVRQGSF